MEQAFTVTLSDAVRPLARPWKLIYFAFKFCDCRSVRLLSNINGYLAIDGPLAMNIYPRIQQLQVKSHC